MERSSRLKAWRRAVRVRQSCASRTRRNNLKYTFLLFLSLLVSGCGAERPAPQAARPVHCHVHDSLPDSSCTPGSTFANMTVAQVCTPGYARSVRNVSQSTKARVYAAYGIAHHEP